MQASVYGGELNGREREEEETLVQFQTSISNQLGAGGVTGQLQREGCPRADEDPGVWRGGIWGPDVPWGALGSWEPQADDGDTLRSGETFHLVISGAVPKLLPFLKTCRRSRGQRTCLKGALVIVITYRSHVGSVGQAFGMRHLHACIARLGTAILRDRQKFSPHFTDEETEAQRDIKLMQLGSSRAHAETPLMSKVGWLSGLVDSAVQRRHRGLRFSPHLCSALLGVRTLPSTARALAFPSWLHLDWMSPEKRSVSFMVH